ncbi:succinoglycan biosynthesis protein exop [Novosphingobium sp. YJ-S2-02]|uniref:Succinoglycan biosynthesis protein exop n=1 Tax=Novosphingobium aureum TaxID=2792964 RepID=A0A931MLQ8_9SPHN|nr:polysaccharide biosynthesis tyrosine autokinase [Novosphingobium aureum]MBH0113709.1 succinoglycan biosynthesis protein exop [Novosphingobium aureum]
MAALVTDDARNAPAQRRDPFTSPPSGSDRSQASAHDQFALRDILRVIGRYRTMFTLIVGGITLAVLASQLLAPTMYRATAHVQVELIDEVGTNQADVNSRNAQRVANAVRLHRSRSTAEQVIKDLDLMRDPRFLKEMGDTVRTGAALKQQASNTLLSMITISSEAGSDLMDISVTARSPELAAEIANQLPASVRELRNQKLDNRRQQLLVSLEEELETRNREADTASQKVADFRASNNMLVGAGQMEDLQQINRVALQATEAQAARDASAARSAGIARAAGIRSTASASSAALDALERRRGELIAERSKMGTSYGPNHPDVKRNTSALAAVDDSIAKERTRVQQAAGADAGAEASRMAALARSEASGAAAQASRLGGAVAALTSMAYRNNANSVQLGKLVRESELAEQAYKLLAARVEQVRAQMQLEGVSSSVVSPAVPNHDPISPAPFKMTFAALIGSSIVAFLIAMTRDLLDDRLRTTAQMRRMFGMRTLGMMPQVARSISGDPRESPVITEPNSLFAEVARAAYSEVRALHEGKGAQVVLISSPLPGDGKSTVSMTLAAAGVAMGERTVVLDLDLRKKGALQKLQRELHFPDLVDIVTGQADLDQALGDIDRQHIEALGYDGVEPRFGHDPEVSNQVVLLSAKEPVAEPAVMLTSKRLKALLAQLRERFDFIVINAPAALAVRDARAMCHFADQTVMVARWGITTSDQMRVALEVMDERTIGGVIFDQVDYAEHARRCYGDSVQFYANSSDYYTDPLPMPPTLGERLRGLFGRGPVAQAA